MLGNPAAFPSINTTTCHGTILVVDDDIDIVSPLEEYLTENGFMAIACTSGKDAMKKLEECDPDILLVDLVMPDINGFELLGAALRRDPHLIGIIITGNGSIQSAIDAMKSGAFDYLLKPFTYEILPPILTRAMQVRHLRKSEARYRLLIEKLTNEVRALENVHDIPGMKELEIFELKEEIETLRKELKRYKEMYTNYFFNGGGFDYS